jgi:hypothetical protein
MMSVGVTVFLAAFDVPMVSILLTVATTDVELAFEDDWELHDLAASEIGLTNAESLQLAATVEGAPATGATIARRLAIRGSDGVSTWLAWLSSDYLRLSVSIPRRTAVRLGYQHEPPGVLTLVVAGAGAAGTLTTGRQLRLRCHACSVEDRAGGAPVDPRDALLLRPHPREISVGGGGRSPLVVRLRLPSRDEATDLTVGQGLRASRVRFERDVAGRPVSALTATGRIEFPELTIAAVPLQAGDAVRLTPWAPLIVRRIVVTDAIRVELEGAVSELRAGPPGALRSRMPTVLEFVYGNTTIQLALGAALALGGAIAGTIFRLGFLSKSDER